MKLNLMTGLAQTGYGIAGKNISIALDRLGVDLSVFPRGDAKVDNDVEKNILQRLVKNGQVSFDKNAPTLNIWHQFDLALRVGNGPYWAYPIFELDRFTSQEKHHLKVPHSIMVSSQWAKDVIIDDADRSPFDVHVVPLGINPDIFKSQEANSRDEYIFFNIGKWEVRKGHDLIPRLFDKAFTKKDNVRLIMLPHNIFLSPAETAEWLKRYQGMKLSSKVEILQPVQHHHNVADIIRQCDCGLFPARAEGWNLELLETMASNRPVITTNYAAHTEFCNSSNSFLVDIQETELASDTKFFTAGVGNWACIDIDEEEQFIEHMRFCYRNRIRNNWEGVTTGEKFTWENSAKKIQKLLDI